uniref:Transmembrane protein 174 n=1 Tax=Salarias fasciatus TaxID=181472 RepID=A0A672H8P1_SALFA
METSAVRTPSAASDSNREAPPAAACDHGSQDLRDTKKTAAALMFSGTFLTLVGITCTAMARKNYFSPSNSFLWGWMLGPIFILCGGIFILLRVMECAMRRCWPYGRPEAEMFVVPVREQPSGRPPFMLHAANRPVVLQGGAAMLCVPPAYSFISQDVEQAGSSLTDVAVALPSYDALFSVDSAAGEGPAAELTGAELILNQMGEC